MIVSKLLLFYLFVSISSKTIILDEEFEKLDFKRWKHDITLGGGGNWEFELYHNNRTNSYVKNGVLYIKPTLTEDQIGVDNLRNGYTMDLWGQSPPEICTGNSFYGCSRTSGAGGQILNPIQSAKLSTSSSFSFRYGQMEVKAKLPKGDWIWPAIWLLPVNNEYGKWPASGEIDIMESRGNNNYPDELGGGNDSFSSTLHWGPDFLGHKFEDTSKKYKHFQSLSNDFHTYGLYWDEKVLYTYIDDPSNKVLEIDMTTQSFWERGNFKPQYENPWRFSGKNAPFDTEFYIVLNVAVGGTSGFFKDGVAGKPWNDKSNAASTDFYNTRGAWYQTWNGDDVSLQIDSIKVWSLNEEEQKVMRGEKELKFIGDSK